MTAEDLHHFRAIRWATGGSVDYFGGLAEVCGPHDRRGYDGELFHILVAEIVEAVHRASGDAQCLPGTNLDGRAVNRPGKDALDSVEDFLIGIVLVGRRRQLLPDRHENLEDRDASAGIITGDEESDLERTNLDCLFRRIDSQRTLLHKTSFESSYLTIGLSSPLACCYVRGASTMRESCGYVAR